MDNIELLLLLYKYIYRPLCIKRKPLCLSKFTSSHFVYTLVRETFFTEDLNTTYCFLSDASERVLQKNQLYGALTCSTSWPGMHGTHESNLIHSWDDSRSARQGILCLLWNPKVHNRVHMNPIHTPNPISPSTTLRCYLRFSRSEEQLTGSSVSHLSPEQVVLQYTSDLTNYSFGNGWMGFHWIWPGDETTGA
jgi:hypothetical protein